MGTSRTLASLTALAHHITTHPHLDDIDVYGVFPLRALPGIDRIEVRLASGHDETVAHLATWAATLTDPVATARIIGGGEGHIGAQVDGLLADGTPVTIEASIPAGLVPLQPGRHPLPLPVEDRASEGGESR